MSPFNDILRGGFPLFILEKFEEKSMNPLRTLCTLPTSLMCILVIGVSHFIDKCSWPFFGASRTTLADTIIHFF